MASFPGPTIAGGERSDNKRAGAGHFGTQCKSRSGQIVPYVLLCFFEKSLVVYDIITIEKSTDPN